MSADPSGRPSPEVAGRHTMTPGQTIGPFFGYALPYPGDSQLVPHGHPEAVRLHGYVLDGAGTPVPDALVEIWQADGAGEPAGSPGSLHRDGYTFTGWGRAATDPVGHYSFSTVEPGRTVDGRPAFFAVTIFARGLIHHLSTRIYLPDQDHLAADPFLASVPAARRDTLLARREPSGSLRFDIQLQGENETVFLSFGGAGE